VVEEGEGKTWTGARAVRAAICSVSDRCPFSSESSTTMTRNNGCISVVHSIKSNKDSQKAADALVHGQKCQIGRPTQSVPDSSSGSATTPSSFQISKN
jgi:hypothetical protein